MLVCVCVCVCVCMCVCPSAGKMWQKEAMKQNGMLSILFCGHFEAVKQGSTLTFF